MWIENQGTRSHRHLSLVHMPTKAVEKKITKQRARDLKRLGEGHDDPKLIRMMSASTSYSRTHPYKRVSVLACVRALFKQFEALVSERASASAARRGASTSRRRSCREGETADWTAAACGPSQGPGRTGAPTEGEQECL